MIFKNAISRTSLVLTGVLLTGLMGCGSNAIDEDAIVAEVGERTIPMREVTDYVTGLNIDYATPADEFQARRRRLAKLIDTELLVIGAYDRALDADIGILQQVDEEKDKFLLDELFRTQVIESVTVPESEVREYYEHAFDRIRFRHILVAFQSTADSILTLLQAGGDFADLAAEHSLDVQTRLRGGDMGRENRWGDLPVELARPLFALAQDELGGPIETDFGWHVVKIISRTQTEKRDFEAMRTGIENQVRRRRLLEKRVTFLEDMQAAINIEYDAETYAVWKSKRQEILDTAHLKMGQEPVVPVNALSDDEKQMIMYRFGAGNEVTLEMFCKALEGQSPFRQPDPDDSVLMGKVAFGISMFDILREEALRLNLQDTEIFKDRVRGFQERLMADQMGGSELVRGVRVSEEDMTAFFEANVDSFVVPAQYHVRELLVYESLEAEALVLEARAGESFEALARQHTKRPGMAERAGDLGWLSPSTYPDFYREAATMKIGEIRGPLSAEGQHSIIQLLGTQPPQPQTYEDVKGVIFERLQNDRREALLQAYLDSMSVIYPIGVDEQVLRSGLEDASGVIDSLGSGY